VLSVAADRRVIAGAVGIAAGDAAGDAPRHVRLRVTKVDVGDAIRVRGLGRTRRRLISDLYHRALGCTPDERGAFLEEACAGDAALRGEVESLLRYESDSARFLETPAAVAFGELAGVPDRSQMIGRQLGPYAIVAPLGSGGMGEVYRARDGKLGRDVAIKILPSHFTPTPNVVPASHAKPACSPRSTIHTSVRSMGWRKPTA
jgi:hypothetical protein